MDSFFAYGGGTGGCEMVADVSAVDVGGGGFGSGFGGGEFEAVFTAFGVVGVCLLHCSGSVVWELE